MKNVYSSLKLLDINLCFSSLGNLLETFNWGMKHNSMKRHSVDFYQFTWLSQLENSLIDDANPGELNIALPKCFDFASTKIK